MQTTVFFLILTAVHLVTFIMFEVTINEAPYINGTSNI